MALLALSQQGTLQGHGLSNENNITVGFVCALSFVMLFYIQGESKSSPEPFCDFSQTDWSFSTKFTHLFTISIYVFHAKENLIHFNDDEVTEFLT